MSKKTITILGQLRSGTSMVSGILHYLGVPIGFTRNQTSSQNPKGYFEDRRFIYISETMAGFVNNNKRTMTIDDSKKDNDRLHKCFGSWIKEIVDERNNDGDIWGFKDVNHIMFTDIYDKYLENPHYIVVKRDNDAIKKSLAKWHGGTPNNYDPIVDYYEEKLDNFIKTTDKPCLVLRYEECLKAPLKTINKIIEFINFYPTTSEVDDALEFITPELNHYVK